MKVEIIRNGVKGWYPNVKRISFDENRIIIENESFTSTICMTKKTKLKIKL